MARHLTEHQSFFGALVEYISVTAKDRSRVRQFGKNTLKGSCVPRAGGGWSGDLMRADCEDLQESEASEIYVKRSKSQEVFVKVDYEFQRANGTLRIANRPRRETSSKKEEGDKKGRKKEDSWSMSGEFNYRHHEEPRLKLYDRDNETFPTPSKYVDVMRQTQTRINNVYEKIINDVWTEAKGVNLSEEWTGTARFQNLRVRLPEGFTWVNGRPTQFQKTTRPDSIWPEAWTILSMKHNEKYFA